MLIKGHLNISGEANFERYSIFQQSSGFGAINYIDFSTAGTKILNCLNVGGNSLMLTGVNYAPNKEVKLFIQTTGAINSVTYPNNWKWINTRITGISATMGGVLTLVSTGFSDNGCWVSYGAQI